MNDTEVVKNEEECVHRHRTPEEREERAKRLEHQHTFDPTFVDDEQSPEHYEKEMRKMQLSMLPGYLEVKTFDEILDTNYPSKEPLVDGLIYDGLTLLSGPSKVGKSFLSFQLGYCVSTGEEFLYRRTRKGRVLYLALEETWPRLQERGYTMFGEAGSKDFLLAIHADRLNNGFEDQIATKMSEYPDIQLIIVDVFAMIRQPRSGYSYSLDYADALILKGIADKYGISVVTVTHNRKMKDAIDPFNNMSGSNGTMAAADTTIMMEKSRFDDEATLKITGRDVPESEIHIYRNEKKLCWEVDPYEETKTPHFDPLLYSVSCLLSPFNRFWIGTVTELCDMAHIKDMKPNAVSRYLNARSRRLCRDYGIIFRRGKRTANERCIVLNYSEDENRRLNELYTDDILKKNDGNDDNDGKNDTAATNERQLADENDGVSKTSSLSSLPSQIQN